MGNVRTKLVFILNKLGLKPGGLHAFRHGTVNDHGQVDGESFANTTVNATTGLPTMHPFLWENDKLKDLGTIGGTYVDPSVCCALNERGEVVGGTTAELASFGH